MPTDNRTKLQELLRELFQFDSADLDFGIYRIMNQKRAEVEAFIQRDLLGAVAQAFEVFTTSASKDAERELGELAKKIREAYGETAIDAQGDIATAFQQMPLALQYTAKQVEATSANVSLEQEAQVFNDLYEFFRRYYDEGDFLTRRRYGRDKYAIPYNGEEVLLHWANRDQYYIKTAETFRDYAFRVQPGGFAVYFKLTAAQTEQNNVKGEKRYFLPRAKAPVEVEDKTCTIFFEYRPLTEEEKATYGKSKVQEAILAAVAPKLLKATPHATLKSLLATVLDDGDQTLLERHLAKYTRRNTSDYFIHKNLRGFLEQELDYYIKNEIFRLDDLGGADEVAEEPYRRLLARAKVVRQIGRHIIDFLAQIEDFQKKLFEKKKFVAQTEYCLTLDRAPEAFYTEIAANKAQWEEWEELFKIKRPKGSGKAVIKFLRDHPALVLDTQFFSADFKDRLLATIDNLDEQTDGLLIHSENFQALRLLLEKYRGQVKCIYIDPPYNTASSSIPYKNDYRHSSWVTMMFDRLGLLYPMLTMDGAIFVSIDKVERTVLEHAMDSIFGSENRIEELIWSMNTNNSQAPNYSTNHEYVLVYARNRRTAEQDRNMFREPKPGFEEVMGLIERLDPLYPPISVVESELHDLFEQHKIEYREQVEAQGLDWEDEKGNDPWRGLFNYSRAEYRDPNGRLTPESKAQDRQGKIWVWQEGDASMPATKQATSTRDPSSPNWRFYKPLHPITGKPCPHPKSGWKFAYEDDDNSPDKRSFVSLERDGRIAWGPDERKVPRLKRMLHEVETNVGKSVFQDYSDGEKQTSAMFGRSGIFLAPKHANFVSRFILHAAKHDGVVLDCFAGSGSTGHAVIKLNRDNRGNRKYILVEVGEYFDTVLKPRIQKAIYSQDWKDGKPVSPQGSNHLFKYIRLESYEDTLNNIALDPSLVPQPELLPAFPDYMLRYMLDHETRGSGSRLSVDKLAHPFDYKLLLYRNGETREEAVDLIETFNYLLGLTVTRRLALTHQGRTYRVVFGATGHESIAIIWRDLTGLDLDQDKDFITGTILTGPAVDRVYANGDCYVSGAQSLDPIFKERMAG